MCRPVCCLAAFALLAAMARPAHAGVILLQDNFGAQGTHLDYSKWTTLVGAPSFLGRTQLTDWLPGGGGRFVVGPGGAELALNTFNPTGFSLYGTHAESLESFQPTAGSVIEFDTRLQLTSLQPGLVYGMYFYGCPGNCATEHDEIDIELVTNVLSGQSPLQVQLNWYADQPLGAGNGGLVNLPNGFDPLAAHDWTILWSLAGIDFLVDGDLLGSTTTNVAQGPMQVNEIAWGPNSDWPAAYSAALQPVSSSADNQSFVADLTGVTVSTTAPEPQTWALMFAGLAVFLRGLRRSA